jgi:hypothetical protein
LLNYILIIGVVERDVFMYEAGFYSMRYFLWEETFPLIEALPIALPFTLNRPLRYVLAMGKLNCAVANTPESQVIIHFMIDMALPYLSPVSPFPPVLIKSKNRRVL